MLHLLPILGFAVFLAAVPPTERERTEPATPEKGGTAGSQVVIDPATGRIVNEPTDGQLERLLDGVAVKRRRSAWELRSFSLPAGGRGVYLDGWADHSLAVEVTPEGQFRSVCSQGDHPPPRTERNEANER